MPCFKPLNGLYCFKLEWGKEVSPKAWWLSGLRSMKYHLFRVIRTDRWLVRNALSKGKLFINNNFSVFKFWWKPCDGWISKTVHKDSWGIMVTVKEPTSVFLRNSDKVFWFMEYKKTERWAQNWIESYIQVNKWNVRPCEQKQVVCPWQKAQNFFLLLKNNAFL